jgi:hypothetical protein
VKQQAIAQRQFPDSAHKKAPVLQAGAFLLFWKAG